MKNLVPKRRFEEFKDSDPWEQRKLGELAQYRRGSFPQPYGKEEWYNGDGAMPFVQVVDVTDSLALAENTKQKISRIAQPKSIFVPKGKVIVTLQGSIGRIAITQYDCFVDRTLLIFESYNRAIDVVFWAYTMQMKFDIEKEKAPGGTIKTITKEALTDFVISLPKYKEQQRIGTFLSNLDHLITLHQRKLDKLKETKSAYLSEMFPKEGEFYPKRRFAGFTDPWEQRKLGELCIKFTDGDWIESKDQSYEGVRLIQTGNVGVTQYLDKSNSQKWISEETFDRLHCEEIFPGDILISRLPEPAGRACIIPDIGIKMITAVDCTIVRTKPEVSNKYLVQYLSTENYFKKVNTSLAGGTRQRVSRSNLSEFIVPMPKDEKEQKRIGLLFENLDNLITLHQRKLDKLQALKQAYLSEMFV